MKFIRKINLAKWENETMWKSITRFGIFPGRELYADVFSDLNTSAQTLSFWMLNEESADRVLPALAYRSNNVQDLSYVIFDSNEFREKKLTIEQTKGDSPDAEANVTWHYDLVDISISDLMIVANSIQNKTFSGQAETVLRDDLLLRLAKSLTMRWIDSSTIKEGMKKNVKNELEKLERDLVCRENLSA